MGADDFSGDDGLQDIKKVCMPAANSDHQR